MIGSFFSRRPTKDEPASASPASAEFDEDTFIQSRFNLPPEVVSKSDLPKGQGSLSLVRFASERGPFMIRKTITNDRTVELAFMKGLIGLHPSVPRSFNVRWTLPKVFGVEERSAETDVYMQVVDGIAFRRKGELASLARPLAEAIYDLSLLLPVVCQAVDFAPPERSKPGSAFYAQAQSLLQDGADHLRAIARFQRQLPRSVCHNDIFWPNLGVSSVEETPEFTFIDFGMLGWNVVGAELHHFARRAVRSKKEAEFFHSISAEFARFARIDARLIEMNAQFYAAMRLMAFEKARDGDSGLDDVRSLCLGAIERLREFETE
jgi:hypothetical protein